MLKNTTYKEKFSMLKEWLPVILDPIKRDLKNDHLKKDREFYKNYFSGKNLNKITSDDMVAAYSRVFDDLEDLEEIGEFITNRWLLKNTEIYNLFEEKLTSLTDDFNELETMDEAFSKELMRESVEQFGAVKTYVFSVLNSVVFPKSVFDELLIEAQHQKNSAREIALSAEERMSLEECEKYYERQLKRLGDKYEKKLLGLQKKYLNDMDTLKKQIAVLQRKLSVHA
ncbi:MAG: hypothetical protein H7A37_09220 [Chlamydiales bacterium]|nr:hypothetical protein [Chlamydiia bacterium]MCP5508457.1 hypothetical protein [Chlamydiales bacterium]